MREINMLKGYPEPSTPRIVGPNNRTITNRIIASYRDKEYFDGDRDNGYGGYNYDGRWQPIVKNMCNEYSLNNNSSVLQIGCEKGFMLNDFKDLYPDIKIIGIETSEYAIKTSMDSVKPYIIKNEIDSLPFDNDEFDLVIAANIVYTINLRGVIKCLKEIERVKKSYSFITLGAFNNNSEKQLFEWWTILGCTILNEQDWLEVMKHAGYTGDYKFTTSKSLNLRAESNI